MNPVAANSHVFISYVRENSEQVDRIASHLRANGVEVWLDRTNLVAGERWQGAISKAIMDGGYFIACFSQEFDQRDQSYMHEELTVAIDSLRRRPRHRTWFIPVMLNTIEIPSIRISASESLADLHFVRIHDDWNAGLSEIARAMGIEDPSLARARNLLHLLNSSFDDDRISAARALNRAGLQYSFVVDRMYQLVVADGSAAVRRLAMEYLSKASSEYLRPDVIITLLTDVDLEIRGYAVKILAAAGGEVIGTILDYLDVTDPAIWEAGTAVLSRIGLQAAVAGPRILAGLSSPAPRIQLQTLNTLVEIGQTRLPKLEELLDLATFGARDVQLAALRAIATLGGEGVPALPAILPLLNSGNVVLTSAALKALSGIGSGASSAVPAVLDLFEHAGQETRCDAALALGMISGGQKEVLSRLIGKIGSSKELDKAIHVSLQRLGHNSLISVLRYVVDNLSLDEKILRLFVKDFDVKLGGEGVQYIDSLLKSNATPARANAAKLVEIIGPAAAQLAHSLVGLLFDSDVDVRRAAIRALRSLGPSAYMVTDALLEVLRDENSSDKIDIAEVLAAVSPKALISEVSRQNPARLEFAVVRLCILEAARHGVVIPQLDLYVANAFQGSGSLDKRAILSAIAAADNENPTLRALLLDGLRDGDAGVRASSAKAYSEKILSDVEVADLLLAASDEDIVVRGAAIKSLQRLRPTSEDVINELVRIIGSSDKQLAGMAAVILGRSGDRAKGVVKLLIEHLTDRDECFAEIVSSAFAEIVQNDPEFVSTLMEYSNWDTKAALAKVLEKIGGKAVATLPYLRVLSMSAPVHVRSALHRAIRKIELLSVADEQGS